MAASWLLEGFFLWWSWIKPIDCCEKWIKYSTSLKNMALHRFKFYYLKRKKIGNISPHFQGAVRLKGRIVIPLFEYLTNSCVYKTNTYCVNLSDVVPGLIIPVWNCTWNIFIDVIFKKKEQTKIYSIAFLHSGLNTVSYRYWLTLKHDNYHSTMYSLTFPCTFPPNVDLAW